MKRSSDERGVTIIVLALAMVGMVGVAGLALDGGNAYAQRRQQQNASDAASLAGTSQLEQELYKSDASPQGTVLADVEAAALANGGNVADVDCRIVDDNQTDLGACPTTPAVTATESTVIKSLYPTAAGVKSKSKVPTKTFLMGTLGISSFTAVARSTAQIEAINFVAPLNAPFMLCGLDAGGVSGSAPKLLTSSNALNTGPDGKSGAIGYTYWVQGNNVTGAGCGATSGSFRGWVDQGTTYNYGGLWSALTGNKNGQVFMQQGLGNSCTAATIGLQTCNLALPVCGLPSGTNNNGSNFQMTCWTTGIFEIGGTSGALTGKLLPAGSVVVSGGQGGGLPTGNQPVAIKLSQ
jgi:Flp pilus assembly protein TadG